MKTGNLKVVELATGKVVKEIPVTAATTRKVERVMVGLMTDMDCARFYVDDSEFNELFNAE